MTSTSVKPNLLPPGLVSNLQDVLSKRAGDEGDKTAESTDPPSTSEAADTVEDPNDSSKPIVLITNGDGIESPGLTYLVEALVHQGLYNVHVCAPQSWVLCKFWFFSLFLCVLCYFSNMGIWGSLKLLIV